jgi:outer membrane protein assembly factor BamB
MALSPGRVLTAAGLCLAAASAGQASWTVYGGSAQHTGVATEPIPAPLSVVWKHSTDYQKDNTASPIVDGDTIYFASKDRVYAVRADTGELKWKSPSGDQRGTTNYRSTPAVFGDTVFVGGSDPPVGGMYALDARTGAQKWKFITGATVRSHPLVVEEATGRPEARDATLYFGSDDDFFYAVDANSGELRWKYHATDDVSTAATFATDSTDLIYFASSDGHLYALNRVNGRPKWTARTPAASALNSPVAFQNRIFLASGNQIYSFRSRTGDMEALIQSMDAPESDITCTPIFAPDPNGDATRPVVYFGDRSGHFYCYAQSRLNWKRVWKPPVSLDGPVTAMPVLAGGTLFVGANKAFVYAINAVDGAVQWRYQLEPSIDLRTQYKYFNINAPLVVDRGRLLVLGDDGTLNAFGTDGVDVAGPVITQPRPTRGTTINGLPPINISAYLWDTGTGINPSTVVLKLDGQPMEASKIRYNERRGLKPGVVYDPVQRKIEYNTVQMEAGQKAKALDNGRHTVQVEATDWKGNISTMEWSFTVDNTLPVRPRTQPGAPGTPGTPGGYGQPGTYGPGAAPGGYGQTGYGNYGNTPGAGQRGRPQPRRRPVRGGPRQPGDTQQRGPAGYGGAPGGRS